MKKERERLVASLKKNLISINISNVNNLEISSKNESVHIRLPEIPLPNFSGEYQDWKNFKFQFENIIHANDKLTDNQNLFYLNSTLSGSAAKIVTLDDSCNSLFKAFSDRFDNKLLICNSHFNEILSLEMPNQESLKMFKTVDTYKSISVFLNILA